MVSPGDHGDGKALFRRCVVGSDLVKANDLGRVRGSVLAANTSGVVPDLDPQRWRAEGNEPAGVDLDCAELGLAQDAAVVSVSVLCAAVEAQIVGEAEKVRELVRYQGDVALRKEGIFENLTGFDDRGILGRQRENTTMILIVIMRLHAPALKPGPSTVHILILPLNLVHDVCWHTQDTSSTNIAMVVCLHHYVLAHHCVFDNECSLIG
mmetsp:Transcript_23535/g.55779  ORF Transcript_23535/g.55779 Transcript_23535/m.55779 type:complete len:209 (-) Transcript_23535:874-1500(-)